MKNLLKIVLVIAIIAVVACTIAYDPKVLIGIRHPVICIGFRHPVIC